jgi:hypothetical protein
VVKVVRRRSGLQAFGVLETRGLVGDSSLPLSSGVWTLKQIEERDLITKRILTSGWNRSSARSSSTKGWYL